MVITIDIIASQRLLKSYGDINEIKAATLSVISLQLSQAQW